MELSVQGGLNSEEWENKQFVQSFYILGVCTEHSFYKLGLIEEFAVFFSPTVALILRLKVIVFV